MSKPQGYLAFLSGLGVIAAVISIATRWPTGVIALALFIGWRVIGTLVTLDDDMSGGSDPDGKAVPEWKTLAWHEELLLCRSSIVVVAFAFQNRNHPSLAFALVAVAIVMGAIEFPRTLRLIRQ
jgi:hypothetical protein